jgi:hypothetical protein
MPVEIFGLDEFKAALRQGGWSGKELGVIQGEYCFLVQPKRGQCSAFGIFLRSSIDTSGTSASTGEDSIRAFIVETASLKPWGGKVSRWTTRLPGWQERLNANVLRPLATMIAAIIPCPSCGQLVKPFRVKKDGANKGRLFVRCCNDQCQKRHYAFLDGEPNAAPVAPAAAPIQSDVPCPKCGKACVVKVAGPHSKNPGKRFLSCQASCGVGWIGWAD